MEIPGWIDSHLRDYEVFPDAIFKRLRRRKGVMRCRQCLTEIEVENISITEMRHGWPFHHDKPMQWVDEEKLKQEQEYFRKLEQEAGL